MINIIINDLLALDIVTVPVLYNIVYFLENTN